MPKLIQARRIRVKLSIADQRPEGKKSKKCKENGALRNWLPTTLFTASDTIHLCPVEFLLPVEFVPFCSNFCSSKFVPCNGFLFWFLL